MLDILQSYINDNTTPEMAGTIASAIKVFDAYEIGDYESGYTELLMTAEAVDISQNMPAIIELTRALLTRTLSDHAITVNPENSLSDLVALTEGVLLIQSYSEGEEVIRTIEAADTSIEAFADTLALVIPQSAENIMLLVEDVSAFYVTRLKELSMKNLPFDGAGDEDEAAQLRHSDKLEVFMRMVRDTPLQMYRLIRTGLGFGFPFTTYADIIGRDLEQYTPERAAQELLCMAICSSDGIDNPRAIVNQHLEHYVADLNKITRIDLALNDLMLRMNHHYE